ncbi:MAG: GSCFA domain-containing protein [Cytophagales bacterium]|nr:GSCFA domain-containing protein [Cytophagales bacterium]MCA6370167.1 GSCFA domain-containing protein [Cytophagales bacterium]MCA6376994.1 GSCFA domain-containing protein [Cytophagales bacterium]MCA6381957.1 GSCFA domain-containing protein [Cytophagales bacterium]
MFVNELPFAKKSVAAMKEWKTDLNVLLADRPIHLNDPILTIGSCFSQAIGQYLSDNKFNVTINPLGTVYSPLSIHHLLKVALRKGDVSDGDFLVHQEVHYHYQFHSSFASLSRQELAEQISHAVNKVNHFISTARFVIITYGTAWAYKRKDSARWVANCHKVPSTYFSKELLSIEAMEDSFYEVHSALKEINPDLSIIVTVSPVRHLKDTMELNSVSKSTLRLFCHKLSQRSGVDYFPAYEIMMDDLRDYRFYQEDRIHPTNEAEEYIWQKFSQKYFEPETKTFLSEWQEVKHALAHRSLFPSTTHHQSFLKTTLIKLQELQHIVNVDNEIALVKNQITTP